MKISFRSLSVLFLSLLFISNAYAKPPKKFQISSENESEIVFFDTRIGKKREACSVTIADGVRAGLIKEKKNGQRIFLDGLKKFVKGFKKKIRRDGITKKERKKLKKKKSQMTELLTRCENEINFRNQIDFEQGPLRINTGGLEVTDTDGNLWLEDRFFSGGTDFTTENPNILTMDRTAISSRAVVHVRERFGSEDFPDFQVPSSLNYSIPAPSGSYRVTLYFSELFWDNAGQRVFDVFLEDQLVIDDLDLIAVVGKFAEVTYSFDVNVVDGAINIDFNAITDFAKISAIQVEKL